MQSPSSPIPWPPSRGSSFSSELPIMRNAPIPSAIPSAQTSPAYVAVAAASQLISEHQRRQLREDRSDDGRSPTPDEDGALCSENALALINAFLDHLLYTFLATARATTLHSLRQAVEHVLKGKMGRSAIASADEELEGLLADGGVGDIAESRGSSQETLKRSEIEMVWRRTRLRIMVYMRLGEMEDEDEEQAVEDDQTSGHDSDAGLVPWESAIFLTAILEFIAEQSLNLAGSSAYDRLGSKKVEEPANAHSMSSFYDDERIIVEEIDVEKLAANSSFGRMWRTWRKQLRTSNSNLNLRSPRPSSKMTAASAARSNATSPINTAVNGDATDDLAKTDQITPTSISGMMTTAGAPLAIASGVLPMAASQGSRRPRSLIYHPTPNSPSTTTETVMSESRTTPARPDPPKRQRSTSLPSRGRPDPGSAFMAMPTVVSPLNSAGLDNVSQEKPKDDIAEIATPSEGIANVTPTDTKAVEDPLNPTEEPQIPPIPTVPDETNEENLQSTENSAVEQEQKAAVASADPIPQRMPLERELSAQSGASGRDNPFNTPAATDNFKEEVLAGTAPQTSASITDFGSTWAQVDSLVLTAKATGEPTPTEQEDPMDAPPPKSPNRALTPPKSRFNVTPTSQPITKVEPYVGPITKSLKEKPLPDPSAPTPVRTSQDRPKRGSIPDEAASRAIGIVRTSQERPKRGSIPDESVPQPIGTARTSQERPKRGSIPDESGPRLVGITRTSQERPKRGSIPDEAGSRQGGLFTAASIAGPVASSSTYSSQYSLTNDTNNLPPNGTSNTVFDDNVKSERSVLASSDEEIFQTPAAIEQMSVPVAAVPTRSTPSAGSVIKVTKWTEPAPIDNTSPSNFRAPKKDGLLARDARIPSNSNKEFVNFIRSTAPDHDQSLSTPAYSKENNTISAIRNRSSINSPAALAQQSSPRSKKTWQPREATIPKTYNANSDLIDFLREGPPASKSSLTSSQRLGGENFANKSLSSSSRTTEPPSASFIGQASSRTSANSYSGLLTSSGPRVPDKDIGTQPTSGVMASSRKQYRNKDPYAIEYSDDELEDERPRDESLIDFLSNASPPRSESSSSPPLRGSKPRTTVTNAFYVGHGLSSNAVIRPAVRSISPVDEDDQPPAVARELFPKPAKPRANAPQPREPIVGGISTHSRPSGNLDLANFLKSTEPPVTSSNGFRRGYDDLNAAEPPPNVSRGNRSSVGKGKGIFGRKK